MDLTEFLTGHNILDTNYTQQEVVDWLDSYPKPLSTPEGVSQFRWVILALSFASQEKLLAITSVPLWYSNLASKISTNNDVIVNSLGTTDAEKKGEIKLYSGRFFEELIEMKGFNWTMQELIVEFLSRTSPEVFAMLLSLLVASGAITEIEMLRLALVELNPTQKRWQSLGLESPPSIEDLPV